jgi:3-hydroxyisobutyrate dehydrogenase-like beta-hydroxyacid dehydrogenase
MHNALRQLNGKRYDTMKMIKGDFHPQARMSQHLKDVDLILSNSQKAGGYLPLSIYWLEITLSLPTHQNF